MIMMVLLFFFFFNVFYNVSELEAQIEALRDTQRKYSQILRLARALSSHFYHVVQTQQQLGDAFADLAQVMTMICIMLELRLIV